MRIRAVIVDTDTCAAVLARPELFASEGRLVSCARTAEPQKRLASLAAELALSYALYGEKLGIPRYSYADNGMPVTEGGFISLSHSGRFAAAAVSDAPVGVDIEALREVSPSAAKRILCTAELERASCARYVLDRFVIKEAFLKMTGEGVWGGLDSVYEKDGLVFRRGVLSGFSRSTAAGAFSMAIVSSVPFDGEPIVTEYKPKG